MKEEGLTDFGEGLSELLLFFWGHGRGVGHVLAEPVRKSRNQKEEQEQNQELRQKKEPGSEAVLKHSVQTAQFSLLLPV